MHGPPHLIKRENKNKNKNTRWKKGLKKDKSEPSQPIIPGIWIIHPAEQKLFIY